MLSVFVAAYILVHSWYDASCCSDNDCRPVPADSVAETGVNEWTYLPTGNKFTGDQIKPSRDGKFHVCIGNRDYDMGKSYCIYIVQGS
jgi:hypothetical protein